MLLGSRLWKNFVSCRSNFARNLITAINYATEIRHLYSFALETDN